ncbi:MAG: ribosome biogenesis GTPase YlqF [Clostridia bacterium]|nr:ribosome biogenesis GTPase YlqF [Clostridia bacterium]
MQIQWYPGHMARAKRLLKDQLNRVDVVLELCDARLPASSRNPDLDALCARKRRIVVLGKADLAEENVTRAWMRFFERQGLQAIPFVAPRGRPKEVLAGIDRAVADAVERQAARGVRKTVRAMVLGIPNVGKSTLINCLRGQAVAKTADRPGVTRSNLWVRVTPYLELLDTPGLLWPKLEDAQAARRMAYVGTIRNEVVAQEELAQSLLEELLLLREAAVIERFRITKPYGEGQALLENACRGRGWLMAGGLPDTERAAALVLDEFRAGKLGRISLERPKE